MPEVSTVHRQSGAAALLLLTALAATALLLVPNAPRPHAAAGGLDATQRALNEAREALLGYAAAYPDRVNSRFGPGYLPCPARDARGFAGSACSERGGTTFGRFP